MTLPSYEEITRQLNIPRCRGITPLGQYCQFDHAEGEVFENKVHWGSEHRPTRAGIRRYLALEAWRRAEGDWTKAPHVRVWEVDYAALRMIPVLAREIKVQLPHKLGDLDRAQLRAWLVKAPPSKKRSEAMRWLADQRSGGARRATA